MEDKKQPEQQKKLELRGKFIGRAKQYLITNAHARQKLAKAFGKSVKKANGEELAFLFEVLTDEIYENEQLCFQSNTKLDAYFFVLTMMAYYWKTSESKNTTCMEDELRSLYRTGTDTTKKKIRCFMCQSFNSDGAFQKQLSSITKLIKNMNSINYLNLLNDLCSWNYCNHQSTVSVTCQLWSRKIFLTVKEEEDL